MAARAAAAAADPSRSIWCCPACRGALRERGAELLACDGCAALYPVIEGIPDLRISAPAWLDVEADRAYARVIAAQLRESGGDPAQGVTEAQVRALVEAGFRRTDEMSEAGARLRTQQVLAAPARLQGEIKDWLQDAASGRFLDLGCGPGMLLAAAAAAARANGSTGGGVRQHARASLGIGVDVCLTWLVVARYLVALHDGGRTPHLAAAFAEALPLADGAVDGVVSLDVVEHVADPVPYLAEIDRVTRVGGVVALATPNRFSLTAEPHVYVWGVGWLPRRWQKRFVHWRSGKSYEYVRLVSPWELRALVRRHTQLVPELLSPPVTEIEIARFSAWRARLARAYNVVVGNSWTRPLTLGVGPFFHLRGRKRSAV